MKNLNPLAAAPGGTSSREQLETNAAPGTISDSAMGEQLTAQYKRAVSGMREVLIFGAMLMQLEEKLAPSVHARTLGGKLAGSTREGGGMKGWLEAHAPEISRPTAYRFLGITKSIGEEYAQIVGAKVAKAYDLPALVLADSSTLDAHAALKQGELFDFVSGTSQRSWLDRFKPMSEIGGYHPRKEKNLTHEEEARLVEQALRKEMAELMDNLERFTKKKHFQIWNDAELDHAAYLIKEASDAVDAWRKLPKGKRLATAIQDSIREWKGEK
jgi:hypothetical protein